MEMKHLNHREDILEEILCHLPRKSLARFKCVSKQWLALILDPSRVFPKTSQAGLVCQSFLRFHSRSQKIIKHSHCFSRMNFLCLHNKGNASSCPTYPHLNDDNFLLVDSCDGFLLYSEEWETQPNLNLVVFHPVTNRSWNLNVLVKQRGLHFGLASYGRHFKLAHCWCCLAEECGIGYMILDVFSSENEEWIQKRCRLSSIIISELKPCLINSAKPVFLNGSFHWVWGTYLVIYHLGNAVCRFLKLPPFPRNNYRNRRVKPECIWESEGCVDYCRVSAAGRRIGIWTLLRIECSHARSKYSFESKQKHWGVLPPSMPEIKHASPVYPFAFSDDFEIVYFMCRKRIFSYNLATKEMKEACTSPFEGFHSRAQCIALPFLRLTQLDTATTGIDDRELRNPCSDEIRHRKFQKLL